MPMAPHVRYQIPYATGSGRLVMGVVGAFFALAIFAWWLPRAIRLLRNVPATSAGQKIVDFESMHELFANQPGPGVVRRCSTSLRS